MAPHILVVEDDQNARTTLAYLLSYTGYRVTQAADGETALNLLEHKVFDVVLTDIVLGDMSGIDVLHAARIQSYVPEVVLLTGHASVETAVAAVREGAYDYLLKPCMDDDLLACIEGATQRHTTERQVREATRNLLSALSAQATSEHRQTSEEHQPSGLSKDEQTYVIGQLRVGTSRHRVTFQDEPLQITLTEYDILRYLAETPGEPRLYRDIVQYTHKIDTSDAEARSLLSPHLRNLRKKLASGYLVTVRGTGYMLVNPDDDEE